MLTSWVKLIYDKKSKLDNRSAISWRRTRLFLCRVWLTALIRARHPGTRRNPPRYYCQIQLVRNGIDTGIMRSVYKNHYDFSSQMTETG